MVLAPSLAGRDAEQLLTLPKACACPPRQSSSPGLTGAVAWRSERSPAIAPHGQLIGHVKLVDVAHACHRFLADLLRNDDLEVVEPAVGVQSPAPRAMFAGLRCSSRTRKAAGHQPASGHTRSRGGSPKCPPSEKPAVSIGAVGTI